MTLLNPTNLSAAAAAVSHQEVLGRTLKSPQHPQGLSPTVTAYGEWNNPSSYHMPSPHLSSAASLDRSIQSLHRCVPAQSLLLDGTAFLLLPSRMLYTSQFLLHLIEAFDCLPTGERQQSLLLEGSTTNLDPTRIPPPFPSQLVWLRSKRRLMERCRSMRWPTCVTPSSM